MINETRLAETFKQLVELDSESKHEKQFRDLLIDIFKPFNPTVTIDHAGEKTGSDTGNLLIKFKGKSKGNKGVSPLLFNAHMDTVTSGKGIVPLFKDGIFTSNGNTILGADDKSAIAILIEAIRVIFENDLTYPPLELVFTICEEIGLQGAKNLDYTMIESKIGYVLDSTDTNGIVTHAPAANNFRFKISGKDAHAGATPENGINAIQLACKAIAELELGRIDHETTCNIGMIEGGLATNIIPKHVIVKGEARSHDNEKLENLTRQIVAAFETVTDQYPSKIKGLPKLEYEITRDFPLLSISQDHPVVALAKQSAGNLGRTLSIKKSGGGSDANIFQEHHLVTGILGTGMKDMHSVNESIQLGEMVKSVQLVLEIIRVYLETQNNQNQKEE